MRFEWICCDRLQLIVEDVPIDPEARTLIGDRVVLPDHRHAIRPERHDAAPNGARPRARDRSVRDGRRAGHLRVEAIHARDEPVFAGVAHEPERGAVAARRCRRGEDRGTRQLARLEARRSRETQTESAGRNPAPQIDPFEVRVVGIGRKAAAARDGKISDVARDAHQAALLDAADVGLADESSAALAAGHRDDLHVLARRIAVGEVDVVISRHDPGRDAL